jgi:hypothetical protein
MKNAHAGTVAATARRGGIRSNFNVYSVLGTGTVVGAVSISQLSLNELRGVIKNRLGNEEYKRIHKFLKELLSSVDTWERTFLSTVRRSGERIFRDALRYSSIWQECADLWGYGIGFRQDVIDLLRKWFISTERQRLQTDVRSSIEAAWKREIIDKLEQILSEDHLDDSNEPQS